MAGHTIRFSLITADKTEARDVTLSRLIVAGWTARNQEAMEAHIAELGELGVPRPARTPMFYRVSANRITTASNIEVIGHASSGEVEFFLIQIDSDIWVGTGSDHTDREAEVHGVTLSKQMCDKPIATDLWRLTDLEDHWSDLQLTATITNADGSRQTYQQGSVETMLAPADLLKRYAAEDTAGGMADGDLMMCGTLPAIGGVRPAPSFEFELADPVLNRRISHSYRTIELPIEG